MARGALAFLFKCARILLGLAFVGWGILSFIFFILPGGLWTLFIGLAILAVDIPIVRRFNEWLRAKISEKFPRFYRKFIVPLDAAKGKGALKMKAWLKRLRNGFWPKLVFGVVVIFSSSALPAFSLEIENAGKMPYPLDTKFIEEIWQDVIRVTNKEALMLKVDPTIRPPKIIYIDHPPKGQETYMAVIVYYYLGNDNEPLVSVPRVIHLYPLPFREEMSGLPYGALAQEFFHETLIHQRVSMYAQHCAMLSRGTLEKVLRFIDARLWISKSPVAVTAKLLFDTEMQCMADFTKLKNSRLLETPR